jgi:two-component system, OmpR family, phosphate regulon response regulator PhoB
MAKYDFSAVRVLVGEQSSLIRQGLRSALFNMGFREVSDTGSFADVHDRLRSHPFDLMILNSEMEGSGTTHLIREIRRGKLGGDPFLVTLLILTNADEVHIKAAIMSGCDDIVLVPFAAGQFMTRMANVLERRKPFIVTHDYIGPDRRAKPRPGEASAKQFIVPNPLQGRAAGHSVEAYKHSLRAAMNEISGARVSSLAKAIQFEARAIRITFEEKGGANDLVNKFFVLEEMTMELIERLRGIKKTEFIESFLAACGKCKGNPKKITATDVAELHENAKMIASSY